MRAGRHCRWRSPARRSAGARAFIGHEPWWRRWSGCCSSCWCAIRRPAPRRQRGLETARGAGGAAAGAARRRGLLRVLALFMVAYAAFATVQVLWAGPYLHDVYDLGPVERGNVLLGMAVCADARRAGGRAARPRLQHAQVGGWSRRRCRWHRWHALCHACRCRCRGSGVPAGAERRRRPTAASCSRTSAATSPTIWPGAGATTGNMAQLIGLDRAADADGLHSAVVSACRTAAIRRSPTSAIFATLAIALAMRARGLSDLQGRQAARSCISALTSRIGFQLSLHCSDA